MDHTSIMLRPKIGKTNIHYMTGFHALHTNTRIMPNIDYTQQCIPQVWWDRDSSSVPNAHTYIQNMLVHKTGNGTLKSEKQSIHSSRVNYQLHRIPNHVQLDQKLQAEKRKA